MAQAKSDFQEIPLVDVSGLRSTDPERRREAAGHLVVAAKAAGFLYVTGHGIPPETIDGLKDAAKRFFALPLETKQKYYIGKSTNHRGYVPRGEEGLYAGSESDDLATGSQDLKEAFDTALDLPADDPDYLAGNRMLGPNVWPEEIDGFDTQVSAYYDAAAALGRDLMAGFALGLDVPEDTFLKYVRKPATQLRLIHYPPVTSLPDREEGSEGPLGIGAHTDFESFTILLPTAPGLQVINGAGEWIEAPPVEGALVINIGDMLETWTNGVLTATSHRVRQVTEERYSFPMFFATDYHTVVEPLPEFVTADKPVGYPPIHSGEHLVAQTMQSFAYLSKQIEAGTLSLPEGAFKRNEFGRFKIEKKSEAVA